MKGLKPWALFLILAASNGATDAWPADPVVPEGMAPLAALAAPAPAALGPAIVLVEPGNLLPSRLDGRCSQFGDRRHPSLQAPFWRGGYTCWADRFLAAFSAELMTPVVTPDMWTLPTLWPSIPGDVMLSSTCYQYSVVCVHPEPGVPPLGGSCLDGPPECFPAERGAI